MPIAFLDRDGAIVVDKHYLDDPSGLEFLPGAVDGLKTLSAMGYALALVTNQSGVGRGYFSRQTAEAVNTRLVRLLAERGVVIDAVAMCPHAPDEGCDCRKPAPGMAHQTARRIGQGFEGAVVIGDKASDIGLAKAICARGILIAEAGSEPHGADGVAEDMVEAAAILAMLDDAPGGEGKTG